MEHRHRCVGGAEHDPARSLFHGCCAVCLEAWPCSYEQTLQALEQAEPGVLVCETNLRDRVDRMMAHMMAPVADPHERVVWWPWHLGDGDREAAARAALKCVRAVDAALAAEEVGRD